ncbi:MAG: cupin domain-containing protein [Flavisolibacter sp.]
MNHIDAFIERYCKLWDDRFNKLELVLKSYKTKPMSSVTQKIMDHSSARHYRWGGDCESWALEESLSLSIKEERMPPHSKEQRHFHRHARQFFYVLKGEATLYIQNEKVLLTQGQGITVLPEQKHYIANVHNEDLLFLVISQPTTDMDRMNG